MKCSITARGGAVISIDGNDVYLKCFFLKENCRMWHIIGIRYVAPSVWRNGSVEILTRNQKAEAENAHMKKPLTFNYTFLKKNAAEYEQFYQALLNELRLCHESEGTFSDGWWIWP